MEKLSKRSDHAYETPSGLFAIFPTVATKNRGDGTSYLEFRHSMTGPVIEVNWPTGGLAIIEQQTALTMLRSGYAIGPTDDQVAQYNKAVDKALEAQDAEKLKKIEEQKAAEAKAAQEIADKEAAEKKAADEKAAKLAAEQKEAEEKAAAEAKAAAEKKAADEKAAAEKAQKEADEKAAAEKKVADEKAASEKKGK